MVFLAGVNFSSMRRSGSAGHQRTQGGATFMTEMATTSGSELDGGRETSSATSTPTSTETQALITEQQVLMSTAAAVVLPPAKTRRWSDAIHAVGGALR